ncbi:unnamed protein product [Arctia plantaginis]|uniref:Metalloendopeptidase n=1 Tax=Arctia plantaginis TaxID=874455 RepID=A0A8S1BE88_ARCPL|nr:unnamed protein product [Arctia plantaginis]CAB3259184.1 unnamed protein product [Arctia plantaginis]
MLRFALCFLLLLGLASAGPALVRSKEEIEDFIKYLDRIKKGNSEQPNILSRSALPAVEDSEELSGRYQGDIVLDDEDYERMLTEYTMGRNAYSTSSITTWPNNVVVYEFATNAFNRLQQNAILSAIADIEEHTCVRFRTRESTDDAYVRITGTTNGCYSHVGYRKSRGEHTMNLGRNTVGVGCFRHATIVHEFMHILGFTHMHTTSDRDNYVDIIKENIRSGTEHNFDIYDESTLHNYGVPYDYVSCLHYSSNSYTINGDPTIVPKQKFEGEMGQREFVTDLDWLRINRHYNCPGAWN